MCMVFYSPLFKVWLLLSECQWNVLPEKRDGMANCAFCFDTAENLKRREIIEENQSIVNRWRKNLQFVVPLLRIYYHKPNLIEQTKFGWDRTWINKRQSNRSKSAHTNNCAGDVVEKLKNFHQFIAWLHISILPPSTKN